MGSHFLMFGRVWWRDARAWAIVSEICRTDVLRSADAPPYMRLLLMRQVRHPLGPLSDRHIKRSVRVASPTIVTSDAGHGQPPMEHCFPSEARIEYAGLFTVPSTRWIARFAGRRTSVGLSGADNASIARPEPS